MNGPIRRLALGLFVLFAVLLGAATWVQVVRADELRTDPRNPRPLLTERGKERGLILAADGAVLARSVVDPDDPRSYVRVYPEGEPFAHLVGYTSFLVGDSGLERSHADLLRSRRDLTLSDLVSAILGRDRAPRSIESTVDSELQRLAYEALEGQRGAVVAIDPRTGAVLVTVSSPSFDPNMLVGPGAAGNWDALLADDDGPLRDRATRELFPPGSTFKTVIAAAALDSGFADPTTEFDDPAMFQLPGSTATISNFDGGLCNDGRRVTLQRAFVRSCNTIFADLGIQLGAEEIGITFDALGIGGNLELPWTVPPAVFNVTELAQDSAALGQSSIGERDVRVNALHMALVAATVANDGTVPAPYLVGRIFDVTGSTIDETAPEEMGRAMSTETAAVLGQLMERVVTEGTGRRAAVPGVRVAGKTGTASGPEGLAHSWFIGFAPVEAPTIALAVFVESGGNAGESATGGSVAAPIASRLFAHWLRPAG